jgi:hypothetical protein
VADRLIRTVTLARPIVGAPTRDDFTIVETPPRPLPEGGFRARVIFASVDPGTRSRLSAGASYAAPLKPGDMIDGFCIAQVTETQHAKFAVGDVLAMGGGWTEEIVSNGRGYIQKIADAHVPLSAWIGVLGIPGMTAWFGLQRVAQLRAGEIVLVTSAAGPVGATAGQIAKKLGAARVVGVAGGSAKCAWLMDACGFDAAIDYKAAPDLDAALRAALPDGADVLFDNVGNAMIDRVLPLMRPRGRIVISGQVADYNAAAPPGVANTRYFIASRLRMEGLVVFDDLKQFPEAQAQMADWIVAGELVWREEMFAGVASLPEAFIGLFAGDSFGRRIVRLGADPEGWG